MRTARFCFEREEKKPDLLCRQGSSEEIRYVTLHDRIDITLLSVLLRDRHFDSVSVEGLLRYNKLFTRIATHAME